MRNTLDRGAIASIYINTFMHCSARPQVRTLWHCRFCAPVFFFWHKYLPQSRIEIDPKHSLHKAIGACTDVHRTWECAAQVSNRLKRVTGAVRSDLMADLMGASVNTNMRGVRRFCVYASCANISRIAAASPRGKLLTNVMSLRIWPMGCLRFHPDCIWSTNRFYVFDNAYTAFSPHT